MAGKKAEGEGASSLNFNSILALLTVVGGLWLVSHKLTSQRPVAPAGGTRPFVGEQTLEARLWEDPLKDSDRSLSGGYADPWGGTNGNVLQQQIVESKKSSEVLLLPVMLSGGHYSEDQESRIRSRFAIGSALNASGYAPEDAEHIGELTIAWPTARQLDSVKEASYCETVESPWAQVLSRYNTTNLNARMDLRYEWYRPRYRNGNLSGATNVLVLWLDDSFFEDEPLLRLSLLLEPLIRTNNDSKPSLAEVALIGPRRSSTLLAMLPAAADEDNYLWKAAKQILHNVTLFCATPSAMDEMLVGNLGHIPRESVWLKLSTNIISRCYNFAATDAQLADEVMQELALRRVDLRDTQKHLVLISESDTFYARVLSLTYAAQLAVNQGSAPDRADFVHSYISGTNGAKRMPGNFHAFSYLRGLDGQTVGSESGGKGSKSDKEQNKERLTSLEELRKWSPDANKAEGQPQFDYLARLGDQLRGLEKTLHREDRGHIEAVGIVGSDVYDTLLILQALRHQFPDALFFTTDLDARLCHPHERDWARNLIVVSGYGLTLHSTLQGEIVPFRDSTQTAQFAAALAALGNTNLQLAGATTIPPRRFEIGNRAAVDLSVTNLLLASTNVWLHPTVARDTYRIHPQHARSHLLWCLVIGAVILVTFCAYWDPLRQLTSEALSFPLQVLDYSEEDVGGPDGAEALLEAIQDRARKDQLCHWLLSHQLLKPYALTEHAKGGGNSHRPKHAPQAPALALKTGVNVSILKGQPEEPAQSTKQESALVVAVRTAEEPAAAETAHPDPEPVNGAAEEHKQKRASAFVALLNLLLHHDIEEAPMTKDVATHTELVRKPIRDNAKLWRSPVWDPFRRVGERQTARRYLDAFLDALVPANYRNITLDTAAQARAATWEIFHLRWTRLICFWLGVVAFGFLATRLGHAIWSDTFERPDGELFSLTSGISAWPAEILRFVVFACATGLIFGLYLRMREGFLTLTRSYRLTFTEGGSLPSGNQVSAPSLWHDYWEKGVYWHRLGRIAFTLPVYFLLLVATTKVFDQSPFNIVRGRAACWWDGFLLTGAALSFIVLAFLTVDAARLCRVFILKLSGKSTAYPEPTLRHFSRQRGNVGENYLDEWIDLHLIGELTERVGRLVYYPAGLLFVLLIARNSWWDCWSWPVALIVIFILNFGLAIASLLILQFAARRAKRTAEESLTKKLKEARSLSAPSKEANTSDQAEGLLEEIRSLRRGAFVPFWENPVVSAVFVPSGGMTVLQMLIWFMGR